MIYIGYFGRAGDPGGANFWVADLLAQGNTLAAQVNASASFSVQPEAMATYPLLADPQSALGPGGTALIQNFLEAIYQNLFARAADAGGLAFWTNYILGVINSTTDPIVIANAIGLAVFDVALGAQTADQITLENKVTASDFLTQMFAGDGINTFPNPSSLFTFAHSDIASVGASEASVIAAEIAATAFEGIFQIPNAGGGPLGDPIDWAAQFGAGNYAQFVAPAQTGGLRIGNAPSFFTLDTQHFATKSLAINAAVDREDNPIGNLCTLIVGDAIAGEDFGNVEVSGYSTVHIVDNGAGDSSLGPFFDVHPDLVGHTDLVVYGSGSGFLDLGNISASAIEQNVSASVNGGTITDVGQRLFLGVTDAETIDASNAPLLAMLAPARLETGAGVTVLGGTSNNQLQGSLGGGVSITHQSGMPAWAWASIVGADNITGGPGGNDLILGDGGPDTITLPPNHSMIDSVGFGYDLLPAAGNILAIEVSDVAYPGSWGATVPTAIPTLFSGAATGGTSADMTTITGFHAASGGDRLIFKAAAWDVGFASALGDLVNLDGTIVLPPGTAQLSAVWVNSGSNSSLKSSDNVLLYDPSPLQNAQQLAAQLHSASGAVALPGAILPGQSEHILVAYDASFKIVITNHAVNIADVDLVNTSGSSQNSTANLEVYASDMVHLTGVSLTNLTSDNIHFI
jgi:hypothetical protein